MAQFLNSLVISQGLETQRALEDIMSENLDDYVLSFITHDMNDLDDLDREPDLIFFDQKCEWDFADVQNVMTQFPYKTFVVLDDDPEPKRRGMLKAGVDEVMSLSALKSSLGQHLLERLLTLKDLAAAEARAEQSEERFREIIEHSNDIIILLDAEGTILYTSPAFGRQMGYQSWEILGQSFFDFLHDTDNPLIQQSYKSILMTSAHEGTALEFRVKRSDGEYRTIEATASNLLRNITVQSVVLNARDVTEQKQAEVELVQYRRHLEDLVEQRTEEVAQANRRADAVMGASPDSFIAIDKDANISFASQHYQTQYAGDARAFQPGEPIAIAFDVIAKHIPLAKEDPRYIEMRRWWNTPEGTREFQLQGGQWVRFQSTTMAETGEIVISTTDITNYKQQQALLAAQSAELETALHKERAVVEQQKTFVSMVSHEFRTPLTIIDGNAQIIHSRGSKLPKEMLERRAVAIRSGVERLVRLIETILSSHAMDSGKMTYRPSPDCDMSFILQECCHDQQSVSQDHDIHLDMRDIPKTMTADEKLIRHIVSNLLSNAVKYSPNNPSIKVSAYVENGDFCLQVKDAGVGIPEHELPKIFSKYFRASTSGGIPGSGLGLSLVKQFVEMHNGEIDLQSHVGAGTVVTVKIPIVTQ